MAQRQHSDIDAQRRSVARLHFRVQHYLAHGLDVLGRDQLTLELLDAAVACDLVDYGLHLLQIHVERIREWNDADSPAGSQKLVFDLSLEGLGRYVLPAVLQRAGGYHDSRIREPRGRRYRASGLESAPE